MMKTTSALLIAVLLVGCLFSGCAAGNNTASTPAQENASVRSESVSSADSSLDTSGFTPDIASSSVAEAAPSVEASSQAALPQPSTEQEEVSTMIIEVGGKRFTATLQDSPTAQAFSAMLPLALDMRDVNSNEKAYYFDEHLPTNAQQVGQIRTGDLMLYGSNCLVLFYESFSSGYSYTRIGAVDNPAGLADALGTGSVQVSFQMEVAS